MTTFGDQLYQYGGTPVTSGVPMFTGRAFFVKPVTGSDGNSGRKPTEALKTLAAALALCTANNNDAVYMIAESNTSADTTEYLSANLNWNKGLTHLIGVNNGPMVSQRSRIAQLSSATGVTNLVTFSAAGCYVSNVQIFQGVADATSLVAALVSGERNVFNNVHFAGVGHATQSATGCASVSLSGSENRFVGCTLGVDTAVMDGDGANLIYPAGAAATRNMFEDCLFQAYISATAAAHVRIADGTSIDRWQWFKNCLFVSESTNKAVDMAEVFAIPAGIAQGKIALQNCAALDDGGAPVWTAGTEGVIWANMVAPAASAAGGLMTNL